MTPGRAWPLGAHVVPGGVNVAVHAPHATALELCTFDETGTHETARHRLPGRTGAVWHGMLAGAGAGLVYGLRAHGPWDPAQGDRFAPHKLLLDPWAREIVGEFSHRPEHRGEHPADNAPWALKARVVDEHPDWAGDTPVRHAPEDLFIYEVHVKGCTMRHPGVPQALRGTYAGLASEAALVLVEDRLGDPAGLEGRHLILQRFDRHGDQQQAMGRTGPAQGPLVAALPDAHQQLQGLLLAHLAGVTVSRQRLPQ